MVKGEIVALFETGWWGLAVVGVLFYLTAFLRNIVFAGALHYWFFVIPDDERRNGRLQHHAPDPRQTWRDFWRSALVFGVYTVLFVATFAAYRAGWTMLYLDPSEYGLFYLVLSLPVAVVIHDTYFYWTHRLLHVGALMRFAHRQHHVTNPTPWTGFSMSATQATIEALIFPLLALVLPLHPLVVVVWLTITSLQVSFAHLGHEILSDRMMAGPGRWLVTSSHHHIHHRRSRGNYGLFFSFWDFAAGTHVQPSSKVRRLLGGGTGDPSTVRLTG